MPQLIRLTKASKRNTQFYSVRVGNVVFYFSYQTVVAFLSDGYEIVCENVWGHTTARHLNEFDGGDKKSRLPYEHFQMYLENVLTRHGLRLDNFN